MVCALFGGGCPGSRKHLSVSSVAVGDVSAPLISGVDPPTPKQLRVIGGLRLCALNETVELTAGHADRLAGVAMHTELT